MCSANVYQDELIDSDNPLSIAAGTLDLCGNSVHGRGSHPTDSAGENPPRLPRGRNGHRYP